MRETALGTLLHAAIKRAPDAPALQGADENDVLGRIWTYQQLFDDATRPAGALLTRFKPNERVAIWSPNTPEWLILEYAAAFAGLTLVTVNPSYQSREVKFVLEQSNSVGLFLTRKYRGNPMWKMAKEVACGMPELGEVTDLDDEVALFRGAGEAVTFPDVKPDDPAQIQYTSGTTGFPKGATSSSRDYK
jgi:fatty-acyl-CoA synthase